MEWKATLKNALVAQNPHPELFDEANLDENGKPRQLLGYFRCDHDGHKWWNTVWRIHENLFSMPLANEFDDVMSHFFDEFEDLTNMSAWCREHAQHVGPWCNGDEYNAFLEGELGFYWFRMRTQRKDYNLYLYCYSKDAMNTMTKEEGP